MKVYIILNVIAVYFAVGILWGGGERILLYLTISLSLFCNVKAFGFIKKYWKSKDYVHKAVLGALLLGIEDFVVLPLFM